MLEIYFTAQFKRDYKRVKKQGRDVDSLLAIAQRLACEEVLEAKYRDHPLTGSDQGHRECHLAPDWLLIYKVDKGALILTMIRTGSHSELLGI